MYIHRNMLFMSTHPYNPETFIKISLVYFLTILNDILINVTFSNSLKISSNTPNLPNHGKPA